MATATEEQKLKFESGGKERSVSYLPLAHISAMVYNHKVICNYHAVNYLLFYIQIADIYLPILIGSTVYVAQPDALKVKFEVYFVNLHVNIGLSG